MDAVDREFARFIVLLLGGFLSFICIATLIIVHFGAIGFVAEYEQLNSLVTELGIDARSEDILGKVADWNMRISRAKKYNVISFIQFWVPDKIANLKPIEIPK